MSWSLTINDLPAFSGLDRTDPAIIRMFEAHPQYETDIDLALHIAANAGLASVTITGCRTVTPGNDDEVVDISVRGYTRSHDFHRKTRSVVLSGPGPAVPSDAETAADYMNHLQLVEEMDE